jgi:hypothetical protein
MCCGALSGQTASGPRRSTPSPPSNKWLLSSSVRIDPNMSKELFRHLRVAAKEHREASLLQPPALQEELPLPLAHPVLQAMPDVFIQPHCQVEP